VRPQNPRPNRQKQIKQRAADAGRDPLRPIKKKKKQDRDGAGLVLNKIRRAASLGVELSGCWRLQRLGKFLAAVASAASLCAWRSSSVTTTEGFRVLPAPLVVPSQPFSWVRTQTGDLAKDLRTLPKPWALVARASIQLALRRLARRRSPTNQQTWFAWHGRERVFKSDRSRDRRRNARQRRGCADLLR